MMGIKNSVMCGVMFGFVATTASSSGQWASGDADSMAPSQCGHCHGGEYDLWKHSKHHRIGVQCNACHGELHSGKMTGCRDCHGRKHDAIFEQWPAVQRFDLPDSNDYVCSVCHQPHRGRLQESKQSCTVCHDQRVRRDVADFHAQIGEWISPTQNDGFVLQQATGPKLWRMRSEGRYALTVPLSAAAFVGGSFLLLPLGIGLASLWPVGRRQDA